MPYINQSSRDIIDEQLDDLIDTLQVNFGQSNCDGELNYVISRIVSEMLERKGEEWRYADIARAVAVFQCAQLEFYDRVARPKEDAAKLKNGDIPAYGGR